MARLAKTESVIAPSSRAGRLVNLFCNSLSMSEQIEKFWTLEDVEAPVKKLTPDEEHAEQFYTSTTTQFPNKKY